MPRIYHKSNPLIRIEDLITIHYENFSPNHYFTGEEHPFWEIVYIDKGTALACNNSDVFEAKEGELLFHAPDVFHFVRGDGTNKSNVFILTFTSSSPAMEIFKDKRILIPAKARQIISNIMFEANNFYDLAMCGLVPSVNQRIGGDQLIRIYLEELFILLYRNLQTQETIMIPSSELTAKIISFLNSNIYNKITIEEICSFTNFRRSQISKIFKNDTGESIMDYYRSIKLKTAKGLLKNTQYTVTEMAGILGYDTPQYFAKCFKTKYGVSPTEYREAMSSN